MLTAIRSRSAKYIGPSALGVLILLGAWLNGQLSLASQVETPTAREMNGFDTRLSRIEARQDNQLFAVAGAALVGGGISGHITGRRKQAGQ